MRVRKHGYDITRILIGYVLSDVHFDWLVGNNEHVSRKSVSIKKLRSRFFLICRIVFEKYVIKVMEVFPCLHSLI